MKRSGPVRELVAQLCRYGNNVGSIATCVGDQRDGPWHDQRGKVVRAWQIAMSDGDMREALLGELRDTSRHCTIESSAGMPQHHRIAIGGPLCNVVVVAGDKHGKLAGGRHDLFGHPSSEGLALRGREHR